MGTWVELTAEDGHRLSAYRADPAGTPRGGLVVAQEIFGVNSHIQSVCDGYAAVGYVAIAPALFDRYERGVNIGYTPPDIARGRELKALSKTETALLDVAAARATAASAGKVGVIGYCWGGYITWLSAARLPGFACAVAYYGGGMTDAIAEKPKCPVMAHFGEHDSGFGGWREALAAAHPTAQVFLYPAIGFNCDSAARSMRRQRSSRANGPRIPAAARRVVAHCCPTPNAGGQIVVTAWPVEQSVGSRPNSDGNILRKRMRPHGLCGGQSAQFNPWTELEA
jgi:carboxymethylenebutenolidase